MQAWVEDLKAVQGQGQLRGRVRAAAAAGGLPRPSRVSADEPRGGASRPPGADPAPTPECPWDREQTERTIVPHTVEEAYEVADAALAGDAEALRGELGDLLFQVYFLSLLLEERGEGDLETVARDVHGKLVRRHPHVFGDAEARTPGRVRERWEELKTEQEGR